MIFASQQSSVDCLLRAKDSVKEMEKGDIPLVKMTKWHYGLKSVWDTDVYGFLYNIYEIVSIMIDCCLD